MASTSTFDERRAQVQENTRIICAKADSADRQARLRARKTRVKKADWESLSAAEQEAEVTAVKTNIMNKRIAAGIDVDSRATAAMNDEAAAIQVIDEEEKAQITRSLRSSSTATEKTSIEKNDLNETITQTFAKNMKPLIERWERYIITAGNNLEKDVSQEELEKFAQQASNPDDVRQYIEKWGAKDAHIEEDLPELTAEEEG